MDKLISIIVPTYNRYDMLKQTIESILMQTYCFKEIIVIDDSSTDATKRISDEYPQVVYLRNDENQGPGYNRKLGLSVAQGEFVVFMDDDDYYTIPSFFESAIEVLKKNENVIWVAANADVLYSDSGKIECSSLNLCGEYDSIEYLKGFLVKYKKPLSTFTCVFRRKILEDANFCQMNMVNDMAIYLRSLIGGKIYFLEDSIGIYRIHSQNISHNISCDFLIKNLEEKFYVYNYIKVNKLFDEYCLWWNTQIKETVGYWVYGSHPSLKDLNRMYHWCMNNTDDYQYVSSLFDKYRKYLLDYNKCKFKLKLKNIIRGKSLKQRSSG